MEKFKKFLPQIVAIAAGVLAIIFAIHLAGLKMAAEGGTVSVSLIGLMFGGGKYIAALGGEEMTYLVDATGGMSIFGLIAFIFLVLGIIAIVLSLLNLKCNFKYFDVIGYALLIIAGIFIFLIKIKITDVNAFFLPDSTPFFDVCELIGDGAPVNFGAGVYVSAILSILAGGFGLVKKFLIKK